MWTDEELAKNERIAANNLNDDRLMSLYRLARLGLAAEQVGKETFYESTDGAGFYLNDSDLGRYEAFLKHPAWRAE